ncbi:hypothetical protein MMC19_004299 [Ptychographa xylographoides]|nr:hypothetical protein [Ptychographa xylographoides]
MLFSLSTITALFAVGALAFDEIWDIPGMYYSTNLPYDLQVGSQFVMEFTVDWTNVSLSLFQTQVIDSVANGTYGNLTIFSNKINAEFSDGQYEWIVENGDLSFGVSSDFFFVLWDGAVGSSTNITSAYFTIFNPRDTIRSSSTTAAAAGPATTSTPSSALSSPAVPVTSSSSAAVAVQTISLMSNIPTSPMGSATVALIAPMASTTNAAASVTPSSGACGTSTSVGMMGSFLVGAGVLFGVLL